MSDRDESAFVTVAMCRDLMLAQSCQNVLAQNGIESFLPEENFLVQDPFMIPALGGVRLSVAAADSERASEILKSAMETLEGQDEEGEGPESDEDIDEDVEYEDSGEYDVTYVEEDGEPEVESDSGPRYLLGVVMIFIFAVAGYFAVNFVANLIGR